MIMKKILSYAIASIASVMLIGCAACKDWFNSVDWNNVNNVVIPVVQVTAQNTSFLVCDKNPDLRPIFITAGNGILLAVADEQFDAEQIKLYIKQALGNDADKYYPIISMNLDMIFTGYITFYKTNWKIDDSTSESDKATIQAVFSKYLSAVATGLINGAKMTTDQAKLAAKSNTSFEDVCKMQVIK